jgi:hypothetical protein
MNTPVRVIALASLIFSTAFESQAQAPPAAAALEVARFTAKGELRKPADLASWVFLGTSLGMGYNPGSFNAANPGQFQVVLMEPGAWQHFVKHGRYAPGSMFMLAFYNADKQARSINQNGFTQADLTNYEIHLIGAGADAERHGFYTFSADSRQGQRLPPNNGCVRCHVEHGAFDGTFAQFYPTLRPLIPKEALERAARGHAIR